MALHIKTDEEFDRALEFVARAEGRSKSDVVRESVLIRYRSLKSGLPLGALRHLARPGERSAAIQRELELIDTDDDLA